MAFKNGKLYVAEDSQVTRFHYDQVSNTANFEQTILELPAGTGRTHSN